METVNDIVEQFTNEKETFIINDKTYIYQYNKLCNAQVSIATEYMTWCLQSSKQVPKDFDVLLQCDFAYWKETLISYLLLEEIDNKIEKFNLDACLDIRNGLLEQPADQENGSRDMQVKMQKISESFFLKRGRLKDLLTFSYRANPKKLTPTEELLALAEAWEKMTNSVKTLSENNLFQSISSKKKKSKKDSTGQ